jgi:hypothetical protein
MTKNSERPSGATGTALGADRPIEKEADDRFRRAEFARVIARHVANAPKDQSLVFALMGAWGFGKTSVLHMIEEELKHSEIDVIWFNPWLFSGTEQITSQFMRELSAQLRSKQHDFKRVGELIENYGGLLEVGGKVFSGALAAALGPLGGVLGQVANAGVAGAVGKAFQTAEGESIRDSRKRLEEALRETSRRIVIFVDDIDRLDGDEIRVVFKLVRLVADFPNVSYVLAFDRARVERALNSEDTTGRAYLEKVVQAAFDLPPIESALLSREMLRDLDARLSGRRHGPLHEREWPDVLHGVVLPLIKTPRDACRFVNAVGPAIDMVGDEVALEDVLALEAVRVFLPDVFDKLAEHIEILTVNKFGSAMERHGHLVDEAKKKLAEITALAGQHGDVARELCKHVFFPARSLIENHGYSSSFISKWRKQRRVAYRDVFEFYLERSLRSGAVRTATVREIVRQFSDRAVVEKLFSEMTAEELETAIALLEDSTRDLARLEFEHGFAALLGQADRLRRGRTHFFDFGADLTVTRLLLWTLKHAEPERRLPAVRTLYEASSSFTWRIELLDLLGRRKDKGDELIDASEIEALSQRLRAEILTATAERIANEREPGGVVQFAAYDAESKSYNAWARSLAQNPAFARALLAASIGEARSVPMGSVAVTVKRYLPLKALTALTGGEDELRTMLRTAVAAGPAPEGESRLADALKLAEDLLAGRKMYSPDVHDPDDYRDDDDD